MASLVLLTDVCIAGVKKTGDFDQWSMYCENNNEVVSTPCSLVQNVSATRDYSTNAWVKSSVDIDADLDLKLILQFDPSVDADKGVVVRIDQDPAEKLGLVRCDTKYCVGTIRAARR